MSSTYVIPTGRGAPRVVALILAGVIAVLGGRNILAFATQSVSPSVAYAIDSGNAEAAAAVADRGLLSARGPDDAVAMRRQAIRALKLSPYAPQAMRNIGFVDARLRGEDVAVPVLALAGRTSMRDFLTHLWLFDRYYRGGALTRSIHEADVVMSQKPDRWAAMFPLLIDLLEDRRTIPPLVQSLARRPFWRPAFLERMGLADGNAAGRFALFVALKRHGQPATTAELRTYFLTTPSKAPPALLRARWAALVPDPALARLTVIDGNFDGVDSPVPFAWNFLSGGDVYSEAQRREDGAGKALYTSFSGQRLTPLVSQTLALAPGRYRLSGTSLAEGGARNGQFVWTTTCLVPGSEIGRLPLAVADKWTRFSGVIDVPPGCDGQSLSLIGQPVANGSTATMWIDEVKIDRAR